MDLLSGQHPKTLLDQAGRPQGPVTRCPSPWAVPGVGESAQDQAISQQAHGLPSFNPLPIPT